jgi:hypothetical protein
MLIAQFVFGLVVIAFGLALLGLVVGGAAWLVLVAVQRLPLVGRRHRHRRWDELNRHAPPEREP